MKMWWNDCGCPKSLFFCFCFFFASACSAWRDLVKFHNKSKNHPIQFQSKPPLFFLKKKQQHQNINLWSVILDLNHLHTPTIHFWSLFLIIYFTYLNIMSSIQYLQTHLSSSIHPHHSSGDHLISVYSKQITKLMSPYLLFRFFQKFNHLIGCNIFINCSQLGNSSPNCVGGSVTGLPIYVKLSKDDQV